MSLKSMRNRVTGAMARQTLTVKTHSPVLLLGLGAVGFTTTVVLACRATLKLSDVLEEGNKLLNKVDEKTENEGEEVKKKAKIGAKLQVAIRVAKLYAPSVAIGLGTLTA